MNKLNEYIDNMFAGLPDNDDVRAAKQTITENMTDKFEELLSEGKNEAEAFGTTISEFGSIKELGREMGWDFWEAKTAENTSAQTGSPGSTGSGAAGGSGASSEQTPGEKATEAAKEAAVIFTDAAKETGATFSEWWSMPHTRSKRRIILTLVIRFFVIFFVIGLLGELLSRESGLLVVFSALAAVALTFYSRSPMRLETKGDTATPTAQNSASAASENGTSTSGVSNTNDGKADTTTGEHSSSKG